MTPLLRPQYTSYKLRSVVGQSKLLTTYRATPKDIPYRIQHYEQSCTLSQIMLALINGHEPGILTQSMKIARINFAAVMQGNFLQVVA